MKKLGILVVLTILLSGIVSATTTCDVNGDGSLDEQDDEYLNQVENWYEDGDMRFDWNSDGKLNIVDVGMYSSYVTQEGWCYSVLYQLFDTEEQPVIIKNYYTTSSGSGMGVSSLWYYLTGKYELHKMYDSVVEYFDTLYVTKTEFKEYNYKMEDRYCRLLHKGNPQYYNTCLRSAIDDIYGSNCNWEWVKGKKEMICE